MILLLFLLLLAGCAAPAPGPRPLRLVPVERTPYDRQKDEYNRKLRLEEFCARHGRDPDYAAGNCKAR